MNRSCASCVSRSVWGCCAGPFVSDGARGPHGRHARRTWPPPTGSPTARRPCSSTSAGCCRSAAAASPGLLVVGADPASPSGTTGPPTAVLAKAFTELGFTATALSTGTAPTAAKIDEAVAAASGKDAMVVATYNVTATSTQRTLVSAAGGDRRAGGRTGPPQPVRHRAPGGVPAALATYCWTDVELRAAARVIAGRADPEGRLPVPVPRADDPGQVLYPVGHGLSYDCAVLSSGALTTGAPPTIVLSGLPRGWRGPLRRATLGRTGRTAGCRGVRMAGIRRSAGAVSALTRAWSP